jgi:hypothetical protein
VNIYVVTDAKVLPTDYDSMVTVTKASKDISTITGYTTKRVNVTTSYVSGDQLLTQFEVRYSKIN